MNLHRPRPCLRTLASAFTLAITGYASAQLTVSPQTDLQQLASTITGPGVTISNPQITCHEQGYGQFQYSGPLLGIDEGILLTSGSISNAVGPNNGESITLNQDFAGAALLDSVTGRTTMDACKFEFDVIPAGDSLRFDFVFGSEEYNEWVGSQFNDVFGFFISGPGITGDPGIGNDKNIALIPGSSQAVTINTVNNGSNNEYYFDNAGGPYVQYDGFTQGLSAFSAVTPCETYHLKLIVADASDRAYDSGVFIAKVKSNPVTMSFISVSGADSLVEGCNNGKVRFTRQTVTNQPMALQYFLHGTAVNGTDYMTIAPANPTSAKSITIPANQAYVDRPITTLIDGAQEPYETLLFILGNPNCPTSLTDTLVVPLVDSIAATIEPVASSICIGGQVQLTATGGAQYTWSPPYGLNATNIAAPVASPTTTRTYSVHVQDGACARTLAATVGVSNLTLTGTTIHPLCNAGSNGAINLTVTNGLPPYTFQWSGPDGYSANTEDITGLVAGMYTVTVTDATCTRIQSFILSGPAGLSVSATPNMLVFGQHISCSGGQDGSIDATVTGGTYPYTAQWSGPGGYSASTLDIAGLAEGTYTVLVTDELGCTATANATLLASAPMAAEITDTTHLSCAGTGIGSATVTVSGGMPNYTYAWSTLPVQTAPTATGLMPGTYTVTATDQYGCAATGSVTISGPSQPLSVQLAAKTDATCFGAANGSATLWVSGGTPGYNITWNTMPVQTGPTASGLTGGAYTAIVTDANGCQTEHTVSISTPAMPLEIVITAQQNISCQGQTPGSATVSASGGTAPYSIAWNTTPAQYGATATGLGVGGHTATVVDAKGCTTAVTVVITGPASGLSADITSIVHVACAGATTGSATVTASGGTGPYSYQWNTTPPLTSAMATGLAAGTWQVVVQDANGCSTNASAILTAPSPLATTATLVPALCHGAANGAIDLETTGGTEPYNWSWTGPGGYTASTQSITSIAAGGYSLVVTDANGCVLNRSFNVNEPGLFDVSATTTTYGNAQVSCPTSADGTIDLTVTGAMPPYLFEWTGPNGFSSTLEDPAGLVAGTYQVTITDANECTASLAVELLAPAPISATLSTSNHGSYGLSCNGGADGSIASQISGGTAPYTLSWTGPGGFTSSNPDIGSLAAGTYQVSITDANGCTAAQSTTLTQPAALVAANGGSTPVSCHGSNSGQANVAVSGGQAPYSFSWNTLPAQHAATATGLAAGTYTATVTDANGCTASIAIPVDGPSQALTVAVSINSPVLCNGGADGSATALAEGGTAPYTYNWNTVPPTNTATANGMTAGTWTVTVTDAQGCIAAQQSVVQQPALPLAATWADQHNVICFGADDGTVSILATGGSGDYTITWNTVPVQTGSTAVNLAPGTYVATVTDNNGCAQPVELPVTIGGPSAPLAITWSSPTWPGGASISCPGQSNGSIDVSVTGGTPSYQFHWQDGFGGIYTTEDLTGIPAGTYQLHIADGFGCLLDSAITLTAPTAITATATIASATCHGTNSGSVDLLPAGGNAPYNYQWNGPGGYSATTQDLSALYAGVYTVLITDVNGCAMQQPFDVTEPGMFTFDASVEPVSCANSTDGAILMDADGGTEPYQFQWTGPVGFSATSESITGLSGGTYHLILTDDNGCSALFSTALQAPPPLSAYSISNKNHGGYDITCAGASDGALTTIYSGGSPPYTFAWTGPGGFTANTPDLTGLAAGNYSLTITDAQGCSLTISTYLVAPPALTVAATAGGYAGGYGTSCSGENDGSIILTTAGGTPAYMIAWSGPNGFAASSWQITGLEPGLYTALVTDANGCTASAATSVTTPDPLTLIANSTDILCHGGTTGAIDLAVDGGSGPYTYAWNGPNAFTATTEDLGTLAAGTYHVGVTDANGCSATTSITLQQPAPITSTADITTTQCQGSATGAIDLMPGGGEGGYTYLWTGFPAYSATSEDISALSAGVYTVVITDAVGCTATAYYNVGEPGLFQISAQLGNMPGGYHVSCANASDGAIDATVTGGTAPYSYFWNGPNGFTSITLDLTALAAGEYHLTVHDANGCNGQASFTLVAPSPILIGLTATALPSCNQGEDGSINASILGGTAPYTASWTGPDGFLGLGTNLTGLGAGIYQLTVTDVLGCTADASITLSSPAGIDATATAFVHPNGTNHNCANSADGSIDMAIVGGSAPYQISWNGPNGYQASTEDIAGLLPGTYTAMITDANGCTTFIQTTLTAPLPMALTATTSSYSSGNAISCAGAADGAISLGITGGSPGYTVSWTGPGGFTSASTTLQGLIAGTYLATVTDAAGCTTALTVALLAPLPIAVDAELSDHYGFEVGCSGADGFILLSVSGGLAPYQYSWSGPNGFASLNEDLENLTAGTYTVQITDANGCSTMRNFTLHEPAALTAELEVTSNECDASSNGAIDLTVTGGTMPHILAWTGPGGFTSNDEDLSGLAVGTYSVTVTSAMGCTTTVQANVLAASPMDLDVYVSDYGLVNIPCHGDSTGVIALTVSGGFEPVDITWSGPGGFVANTPTLSGLLAGLYTATITDDHGCVRDTSIILSEPVNALLTVATATSVACHGEATGSITTTVTGGNGPYAFDWRGPDSASYSTADITNLVAGVYELVVIDANQCVDTLHATIHQPDSAVAVLYSLADHHGFHTTCFEAGDGAVHLSAIGGTPGYTYTWSGPNGYTSDQDSISGLSAGTYMLTVTDATGCELTETIILNAPPPIVADLMAATFPSGSTISCFGANDGSITSAISGGTAPYMLLWSGPDGFTSTAAAIDTLAPGTYCLTVTDTNACSTQQCITLVEPDVLSVASSATDAACGQAVGTVDATITGGSAPYDYTWDSGAQTEDLANVSAGTYALLVTDTNGCTASTAVTVDTSPAVEAEASVDSPLCHGVTDGSISLAITGGQAPFTYLWSDGSTGASLNGIGAGSFTIAITDDNGCTWEQNIAVTAPDALAADTAISNYPNGYNVSTWGGSDGSIALNVSGGTPPYTYLWSDGAITGTRTALPTGTYTVTITDANGCTLELTIVLEQPDDLAMPTGFTPNGDGQNDAFVVHGLAGYPNNQITIFNRWGNVVYDRLNYANDWGGENRQGEDLPNGTYFVVLKLSPELTLQNYVDLRR